MDKIKTKTWKREIAVAMFLWIGVLSHDPENLKMVEALIWPVSFFGLGAFGLDAASKQLQSKFSGQGPSPR